MNELIDSHWVQVSESISTIEALAEQDAVSAPLAAFVASKCYYHLGEYKDALRLALASGAYFDVNAAGEYVETIVCKFQIFRIQQTTDILY